MYYIGIDLGGTNVAAGIVDGGGRLLGQFSRPTPKGAQAVAQAVANAAQEAARRAGVDPAGAQSVGLASPGSIDPAGGIVEHAFNLGLDHVPLAGMVSDLLGLPAVLENDANAAALGEFVAGAGKEARSLVAVTLGTGVGAGAVLDGKLYTGFNYAGMRTGDPAARAVVEDYVGDLACGIVNLVNLFQPEVLCVGGGVSKQGEALLAPIRAILDREEFTRDGARRTRLCPARLGNDAGIIGAALVPVYR